MFLEDKLLIDTTITSPIKLEETYKLRLISSINEKLNSPINFTLPDSPFTLPIDKSEIVFDYETLDTNKEMFIGTLDTDTFYPLNTIIIFNGSQYKLSSFRNIVIDSLSKTLNVVVEIVGNILYFPKNDTSLENLVMDKVNTILQLDYELKRLLKNYKISAVDYSSNYVDKLIKYEGFKTMADFITNNEYEMKYLINSIYSEVDNTNINFLLLSYIINLVVIYIL
jgi:hypothetical protein